MRKEGDGENPSSYRGQLKAASPKLFHWEPKGSANRTKSWCSYFGWRGGRDEERDGWRRRDEEKGGLLLQRKHFKGWRHAVCLKLFTSGNMLEFCAVALPLARFINHEMNDAILERNPSVSEPLAQRGSAPLARTPDQL